MSEEIDVNKVAAEFALLSLEKFVAVAAEELHSAARRLLKEGYKAYVRNLLERNSKAKSFFIRSEPVPLYRFFVPLDLKVGRRTLQSPGVADVASASPFAIILGSGGSGKSMMMRHFLLSALMSGAKVPVFVELRHAGLAERSLLETMLVSLQDNGLEQLEMRHFEKALAAGKFLILLDGFDELDKGIRKSVTKEIRLLVQKYNRNWLFLSSRPDAELESWSTFTVLRVAPLDLKKAKVLVECLPFDDEVKGRFVEDLEKGLFSSHRSFLSNPLLLSIMLLTYHETAHIPNKLSVFYNQAYEALFQKHDALKGGFQRQRLTKLDVQDFSKVFSAFCLKTYDKRMFSFTATQAMNVLDECKKLTQVSFKSEDFLDDACQAVCLLIEEGLELSFAHRSFQEYFAARYVSLSPLSVRGKLIRHFAHTVGVDDVMGLLYEMDPVSVEAHYVLPFLQDVRVKLGVKRSVGVTHFLRYTRLMFEEFEMTKNGDLGARVADLSLFYAARFALSVGNVKRSSGIRADHRVLKEIFAKEFPEGRVSVSRLKSTSPFVRALMRAPGGWGLEYLSELLALEKKIQKRHRALDRSLEAILG